MLISNLENFAEKIAKETRGNDAQISIGIGIFDGFHKGHFEIFSRTKNFARERGGLFGALTFDPHPKNLLLGNAELKTIFSLRERLEKFEKFGSDFAILENFTFEFAAIPAENFAKFLKEKIPNLASIHVGENFKFGAKRRGNVEILKEQGEKIGIFVEAVPAIEFSGEKISSTRIRQSLKNGEISAANKMLFENFSVAGTISKGKQLGRKIGFPTLNLPWKNEILPKFGVYAVRVFFKKTAAGTPNSEAPKIFRGVANFGIRPTVEIEKNPPPILEIFLLGNAAGTPISPRGNEILPTYGDEISVEFLEFLRGEQRFESIESLKNQLGNDVSAALAFFKN